MKFKLIEKKPEVEGVVTFIFEPEEPLTWKAGQYLHYVLHHLPTDDRGSDRWFTVSSAPYEQHPQITTRFNAERSSSFKTKLQQLEIGKSIEISRVEGHFTVDDPNQAYVFLAGGIGVTPYRSIIRQLDHDKQPINVTLLYANRDQNIVFKDEFEEIASRNPNFKIQYVISPQHIDESVISQFVSDIAKPLFYVSGPEPMVDALGEMLKKMGVPGDHLKQDWFPNYPME